MRCILRKPIFCMCEKSYKKTTKVQIICLIGQAYQLLCLRCLGNTNCLVLMINMSMAGVGWFVSNLVRDPADRFSSDKAHILFFYASSGQVAYCLIRVSHQFLSFGF